MYTELDCTGLNCPLPILRAKKALSKLSHRDQLRVVATDPGSVKDFEAFCKQATANKYSIDYCHELLESKEENGRFSFVVRKIDVFVDEPYSIVLAFEIDGWGQIRVKYRAADGRLVYADKNVLPSGLYIATFNKWNEIIKELEEMINSDSVKEQDLQKFFETYPQILHGGEYNMVFPQALIYSEDSKTEWKADFVLSPHDQEDFCKVLELKLPEAKFLRSDKSGHARPYRELLDAIQQLKDYGKAFQSHVTQQRFKERYGVDVYRPDLQLIYGRSNEIQNLRHIQELQRENSVSIKTWDAVIDVAKRKLS